MSTKVFFKIVHTFITLGSCQIYLCSEVFQQFSCGSGCTREWEMYKHTLMLLCLGVLLLTDNTRKANF